MNKKKIAASWVCIAALTILSACGGSAAPASGAASQIIPGVVSAASSANAGATAGSSASVAQSTSLATGADTVAAIVAENAEAHDDAESYSLDMDEATTITLNGNATNGAAIEVGGSGVTVSGSVATITAAGTYSLSGSLSDVQIVVNTTDKEPVKLILNGVSLSNSSSAPIYVIEAKETVIVLADGSQNSVSDAKSDSANEEPNAAIFSTSDLTIYGGGSLSVTGNSNDGIASKDGLVIAGGTLSVTAADDGIRGKDYLVVRDGQITVNAKGDGLKADNAEDATKGYIAIEGGTVNITSGMDAIEAETDVAIAAGTLTLSSGGGYKARIDETTSAKGIKGLASVVIGGGTFSIDAADDAVHSNSGIVINGGSFAITTGDDGLHADATLKVNNGVMRIASSYEGLESEVITINGGEIHVVSSDDGLNVAAGRDGSGTTMVPGAGGRPGQGGGPGLDTFANTGNGTLYINGGYIVVDAAGDGIDINGAVAMTDGVLIVNGPTMQMNGALDYDAGFNMTGGFLIAAGSSGMAQAPSASSSQNSLLLNFSSTLQAGTLVHIQSGDVQDILTFKTTKQIQSLAFSSPALVKGATYDVYTQGSSTGTVQDGLYEGGTYSGGTKYTSFTVSSAVTAIGTASRMR